MAKSECVSPYWIHMYMHMNTYMHVFIILYIFINWFTLYILSYYKHALNMLWLIPLHFLLCFILFYSKNILQLAGASDELAFLF